MRDLTFYLVNTLHTTYYRLIEAGSTHRYTGLSLLLLSSRNSNTFLSRSRGWPQHRQQRFPSTPRVCPFKCAVALVKMLAIDGEFVNCSVLPWRVGDLAVQEFQRRVACGSCCWHKYMVGGLTHKIKIPVQELRLKCCGGLYVRGHYGNTFKLKCN